LPKKPKEAPKAALKLRSRKTLSEDLQRINRWFDEGLISVESFDRQKAEIIKSMEES